MQRKVYLWNDTWTYNEDYYKFIQKRKLNIRWYEEDRLKRERLQQNPKKIERLRLQRRKQDKRHKWQEVNCSELQTEKKKDRRGKNRSVPLRQSPWRMPDAYRTEGKGGVWAYVCVTQADRCTPLLHMTMWHAPKRLHSSEATVSNPTPDAPQAVNWHAAVRRHEIKLSISLYNSSRAFRGRISYKEWEKVIEKHYNNIQQLCYHLITLWCSKPMVWKIKVPVEGFHSDSIEEPIFSLV